MKKLLAIFLAAMMLLALVACGNGNSSSGSGNSSGNNSSNSGRGGGSSSNGGDTSGEKPRHLIIATTSPLSTSEDEGPYTGQKAIVPFMRHLEEISGGLMTAECSWNGSLGNTAQLYAQTANGDIDIHLVGMDTLNSLKNAEDTSVFSVPFLFDDFDHVKRYTDSESFQKMMSSIEEANNLKYIGTLAPGMPRSLNTVKSISSPDQLANMKIRIAESPASIAAWTLWGANPVVFPATDVYSGLENGQCDGWENSITAFYSMKTYEVAPYITEINYCQQGICCWMGLDTYNELTDQQKAWIKEAMDYAYENAMAIEAGTGNNDSNYELEKAKYANDPDCDAVFVDFDMDEWRESGLKVARQMEGEYYSEGLFDDIRALSEE